jgi:hypothetical protein
MTTISTEAGSKDNCRLFTEDDIAVWADGSWATLGEVWNGECTHKSDDYEIIREEDNARLFELGIVGEAFLN